MTTNCCTYNFMCVSACKAISGKMHEHCVLCSGHRPRVKYQNRKLLRICNKTEIVAEQKNYMWVDLFRLECRYFSMMQ